MKPIIFCALVLSCFISFSQEGYKFIDQAEKQIEKGNYKKASKLLDKADSADYGFCGLAWIEARWTIAANRTKIRAAKGEYLEAANELNSMTFYLDYGMDILRMKYYIQALGKERIKRDIDSCLESMTSIDTVDWTLSEELYLNVGFSEKPYGIPYDTVRLIYMQTFSPLAADKDKPLIDRFRIAVRNQEFYKLLTSQ